MKTTFSKKCIRPTAIVSIVAISLWVLLYERASFLRYAATGLAWMLLFSIYSWHKFSAVVPNYYQLGSQLDARQLGIAMLGNLVSPSRGLVVFVPTLFFGISANPLLETGFGASIGASCIDCYRVPFDSGFVRSVFGIGGIHSFLREDRLFEL